MRDYPFLAIARPVRRHGNFASAAGISEKRSAEATFFKGEGCQHCGGSGFRGRIGIYELMFMTSKIRELAFEGVPTQDIRKAAIRDGMDTLYVDGIDKVCRGITTLSEVYRVAKRTEEDVEV